MRNKIIFEDGFDHCFELKTNRMICDWVKKRERGRNQDNEKYNLSEFFGNLI
jgi:hypothetical protein